MCVSVYAFALIYIKLIYVNMVQEEAVANAGHAMAGQEDPIPGFMLFDTQINMIVNHALASNPMFLRTLLRYDMKIDLISRSAPCKYIICILYVVFGYSVIEMPR